MVRALVCVRAGDPCTPLGSPGAALELVEQPPQPLVGGDAVRVRVHAAALNWADALLVKGEYQEKPRHPFVPGGEAAGVVLACGPEAAAAGLKPGARVLCLLPRFGAFSDEVVLPARDAVLLPAHAPLRQAAGLAVAHGTAHLALHHRCRLRPGQVVLVLGAASGVGLAAVALARQAGAIVLGVATGAGRCAAVSAEGAALCVDAAALLPPSAQKGRDAGDALRRALAPALPPGRPGVDVLVDCVGGPLHAQARRCLAWGAQIVVIGFAGGGAPPSFPGPLLLVKNWTVHGLYWGSYAAHDRAVLIDSLAWLAARLGRPGPDGLTVRVSHAFPLRRAHEGFAVLRDRRAVGKVLLLMGGAEEGEEGAEEGAVALSGGRGGGCGGGAGSAAGLSARARERAWRGARRA